MTFPTESLKEEFAKQVGEALQYLQKPRELSKNEAHIGDLATATKELHTRVKNSNISPKYFDEKKLLEASISLSLNDYIQTPRERGNTENNISIEIIKNATKKVDNIEYAYTEVSETLSKKSKLNDLAKAGAPIVASTAAYYVSKSLIIAAIAATIASAVTSGILSAKEKQITDKVIPRSIEFGREIENSLKLIDGELKSHISDLHTTLEIA